MSAEEAIARAKEIAARLAGTSASASVYPDPAATFNVNAVADAALAAAFGQSTENSASGGKRKRWGDDSGSGQCKCFVSTIERFPNLIYSIRQHNYIVSICI